CFMTEKDRRRGVAVRPAQGQRGVDFAEPSHGIKVVESLRELLAMLAHRDKKSPPDLVSHERGRIAQPRHGQKRLNEASAIEFTSPAGRRARKVDETRPNERCFLSSRRRQTVSDERRRLRKVRSSGVHKIKDNQDKVS